MNQELYHTRSLNLASYLNANGKNPVKVVKEDGNAVFYFTKTADTKVLVDMYFNDLTLKRFIVSYKEIREMAKNAE